MNWYFATGLWLVSFVVAMAIFKDGKNKSSVLVSVLFATGAALMALGVI